ncbi:MAG TPA: methyltransferase [Acidobacteriaceae bacterium]|nr:methyltransferase [Acidobacteriaceae bacterium]
MKKLLIWADCVFFLGFFAWIVIVFRAHLNLRVWVGIAVALAGFVLWITARLQLGNAFSLHARAIKLVTTGLYRRFRHPVYLFAFIAFAGVFLAWGRWIPFLCYVLVFLVIEIPRLRKEEHVLDQEFGEQYRRYRASTWF